MTNAGVMEGLGPGKCGEQVEESSRIQPAEDPWLTRQGEWVRNPMVSLNGPDGHLSGVCGVIMSVINV